MAEKILVPNAVYRKANPDGSIDWFVVGPRRLEANGRHYRYIIHSVRYGAQIHDDKTDATKALLKSADRWDPEHDCLWSVHHGGDAVELETAPEHAAA